MPEQARQHLRGRREAARAGTAALNPAGWASGTGGFAKAQANGLIGSLARLRPATLGIGRPSGRSGVVCSAFTKSSPRLAGATWWGGWCTVRRRECSRRGRSARAASPLRPRTLPAEATRADHCTAVDLKRRELPLGGRLAACHPRQAPNMGSSTAPSSTDKHPGDLSEVLHG